LSLVEQGDCCDNEPYRRNARAALDGQEATMRLAGG
jgi:hypothetical protein